MYNYYMNKKMLVIASFMLLLIVVKLNMSYYNDYQTSLFPGVYIQDDQTDLIANSWSVPLITDWNRDGRKDLLTGNKYRDKENVSKGYISFYKNKGTDSSPVFDGFEYIKTCAEICSDLVVTPDG